MCAYRLILAQSLTRTQATCFPMQYDSENDDYEAHLQEILDANNVSVKDMKAGLNALTFNRERELLSVCSLYVEIFWPHLNLEPSPGIPCQHSVP